MRPASAKKTAGKLERAGHWVRLSRKWAPRLARGLVAELVRPVARASHQPDPHSWQPSAITASWLGHATVLINFFGFNIITDPVLSKRIGACWAGATLGPKRLVAPALTSLQLPPIDLILLSHAHLDHLHFTTLSRFPPETRVITATHTKDLLAGTGLKNARELDWGQSATFTSRHRKIRVEAFEVNHWGARWKTDSHRGFNGYILERNRRRIIFGGDTGQTESFKKIRDKGPFEFAVMPIGSYKPGETSHCTPEEAVEMANDAGAFYILPIHYKTFKFGRESASEPIERLQKAVAPERIGWLDIGQTFTLDPQAKAGRSDG